MEMQQQDAATGGQMTAEDALDRAMDLLQSPEYSEIVGQALMNAKSVPVAAATVVAPIILRMQQESGLPDDELLGNEQGDGIAIYLLKEVFEIAAEAGLVPGGEQAEGVEDGAPPEARAMAEEAVALLADMLAQGGQAMAGTAPDGQPPAPEAPPKGGLLRGGV